MTAWDGDHQPFNLPLFIAALEQHMTDRDVSLHQLERAIGVSRYTISRTLNGQLPGIVTFGRLIEWMGISADMFFEAAPNVTFGKPSALPPHVAAAVRQLRRALEADYAARDRSS